ncbi:protease inhibitor I42 family protein [Phenylobacterium sp.]|uniref:protease inhibitor I42 family protein n=1 Tax=Phenylobacterium sp. TaxID=1871053 RepID=UPI00356AAE72
MAEPPSAHIVSEADNGAALRLARGEAVTVILEERPTTGFRWKIARAPVCCDISDDAFEAPAADAPPGAPGRHSWRLKATKPGSGPFEVRLAPLPGRGGKVARSFTVNLTASD